MKTIPEITKHGKDLMAKAVELDTTRQKASKKSKDASGA